MSEMNEVPCDRCKGKPAEVEFTDVSGDGVQEYQLCRECAQEMGADEKSHEEPSTNSGFSVSKLVADMEGKKSGDDESASNEPECTKCGFSYGEFKETGKLGCATCYGSFEQALGPLLMRIHGRLSHTGRRPGEGRGGQAIHFELSALRKSLADAVAKEEYEEAARIRDRIEELKDGGMNRESGDS